MRSITKKDKVTKKHFISSGEMKCFFQNMKDYC